MISRIRSRHNGLAQAAMEAVTRLMGELGEDDSQAVATKEQIVNEATMQLSNVE